jgi:hypothetical protein
MTSLFFATMGCSFTVVTDHAQPAILSVVVADKNFADTDNRFDLVELPSAAYLMETEGMEDGFWVMWIFYPIPNAPSHPTHTS